MDHITQHLVVAAKNLELQKADLKPQATGEEQSLAVAVKESTISNLSDIEPLKQALRFCMVMVGLREKNFPADAEKTILLDFITRTYPNHTCSEIKLAFEMAIAGKLEVEVNHYENFSVLYFSNIMNAYRKWAKEAFKHAVKETPKELPAPEISDADYIEAVYNTYKITGQMALIPVLAYQILKPLLNLTPERKAEIKASIHFEPETSEESIQLLCKQKAVALYFENNYKK